MALRQGLRTLARRVADKGLPQRGGGGGPVKYEAAPDKPLPLWDELWWDDGLKHSQPVLDFTVGDAHGAPARNALQLFTALGVMVGGIFACKAAWSDDKMLAVPPQYPPEVLEAYTKRGKVLAREPKLA